MTSWFKETLLKVILNKKSASRFYLRHWTVMGKNLRKSLPVINERTQSRLWNLNNISHYKLNKDIFPHSIFLTLRVLQPSLYLRNFKTSSSFKMRLTIYIFHFYYFPLLNSNHSYIIFCIFPLNKSRAIQKITIFAVFPI